jgi:hypothetical protein
MCLRSGTSGACEEITGLLDTKIMESRKTCSACEGCVSPYELLMMDWRYPSKDHKGKPVQLAGIGALAFKRLVKNGQPTDRLIAARQPGSRR